MLDAVFVTILLLGVNSALRPIGRFIDQRSLARINGQIFYRVRLICEAEHRVEVERQVTCAIAERSLVLRELATEESEETATTLVQTVVESSTRDRALLNRLVEELRALPWVESVDWIETEADAE